MINLLLIGFTRKPSLGDTYHYFSHPLCHDIGSIYSLVDKALLLSHSLFHKKNLELVINLLLDNGFSLNIIFNKINIRLKKLFNSKLKARINTQESIRVISTEHAIKKKFMSIPYIKGISEMIASALNGNDYIVDYRCLQ